MSLVENLRDVTVLDTDGRPVRLGSLFTDQDVVLVFVRHFG
jgi:hypothetical protein